MHPQHVLTSGKCILSMCSPLKHASSACAHLWNMHPQHVLTSGTCILSMYSHLEHASSVCTHLWNMQTQHVLSYGTCILRIYSPLEHSSTAYTHLWNMHPHMHSPLEHASSACTHLWNMHPQHVLTSGTCILSMYWLISSKLFMYSSWFLVDWAIMSCGRRKRPGLLLLGVRNGVIHFFFIHNLL
jgi:hypothetical protein